MTTPKLKEIWWKNRCLSVETSISIIFHTRNWCWRKPRAIFKACLLFGALQGVPGHASVARHCPCDHNNDCVGLGLQRTFRIWRSVFWAVFKSRPESDLDKFEWVWSIGQLHKQVTIQTQHKHDWSDWTSLTILRKKFDHHYVAPSDKE